MCAGCGRQLRCQCHSALLGVVTGLASLGGLMVYVLQLASYASAGRSEQLGAARSLGHLFSLVTASALGAARTAGRTSSDHSDNSRNTPPPDTGESWSVTASRK